MLPWIEFWNGGGLRFQWKGAIADMSPTAWPGVWVVFCCMTWTGWAQAVNPNNPGGSPNRSPAAAPANGARSNGGARGGVSAARSAAPARSAATNPVHVYAKKEDAWKELESDSVSLEKGSAPGVLKGNVDGAHSEMRLAALSELSIHVSAGGKATGFQLLHLHSQSDQRTFRAAALSASAASPDAVKFKAKDVAPNTYLLSFPALTPGEYGLLAPLTRDTSGSPSRSSRLYSFRIVKE
jgi:hypothetical protein